MFPNNFAQQLKSFLRKPETSHYREILLRHFLQYELMLAAGARDYQLKIYLSEIDHEGFDLVLDDNDLTRKIQLKSIIEEASSTAQWEIHADMLRPLPRSAAGIGFEESPFGTGSEGGIVIQVLNIENEVPDIRYEYTDVYVLRLFADGLLKRSGPGRNVDVSQLISQICRVPRNSKVQLARGLFLRARGPCELLDLMGFHSFPPGCDSLSNCVPRWCGASEEWKTIEARTIKEYLNSLCEFVPFA